MEKEINKDIVKFNLERLKGEKVAVNCKTKEQFQNFINWVNSLKNSNSKSNCWREYQEDSCVRVNLDLTWFYCGIYYFKNRGYEIISYEEALLKEPKETTDKDIEPTKLSDFLKENNCYEEFINNFDKDYRYEDWKRDIDCSIYASFVWASSEDDFYFWNNINDKWVKLVNKENDLRDFFEDKIEEEEVEETKKENMSTEELLNLLANLSELISSEDLERADALITNLKNTNELLFNKVIELQNRLEDVKTVFNLEFSY